MHGRPPSSAEVSPAVGVVRAFDRVREADTLTRLARRDRIERSHKPAHQFREVDLGQGERLPPRTESLQRVEVGGLVVRSLDCDGEEREPASVLSLLNCPMARSKASGGSPDGYPSVTRERTECWVPMPSEACSSTCACCRSIDSTIAVPMAVAWPAVSRSGTVQSVTGRCGLMTRTVSSNVTSEKLSFLASNECPRMEALNSGRLARPASSYPEWAIELEVSKRIVNIISGSGLGRAPCRGGDPVAAPP